MPFIDNTQAPQVVANTAVITLKVSAHSYCRQQLGSDHQYLDYFPSKNRWAKNM